MTIHIHHTIKSFTIPLDNGKDISFAQTKADKKLIAEGARSWVVNPEPLVENLVLSRIHLSARHEDMIPLTYDEEKFKKINDAQQQNQMNQTLRDMMTIAASHIAAKP